MFETFSLILVLLAVAFAFGRWHEEHSLFYPSREQVADPADFGLSTDDIFIESGKDGEKIHAWHFKTNAPPTTGVFTIFYAHGNAGNNSDRLDVIKGYVENGFNVFIYDPRGYGKSGGKPSRANFVEDAFAAYDFLINVHGVDSNEVIILGQSLGGVPALRLAVNRKCRAVVLEGAFHSIRQMARDIFGIIPIWILASSDYDNAREIVKLKVPVLFIHGTSDSVVPFHNSEMLYEIAPEPKELLKIEGSEHTTMYETAPDLYYGTLKRFAGNAD